MKLIRQRTQLVNELQTIISLHQESDVNEHHSNRTDTNTEPKSKRDRGNKHPHTVACRQTWPNATTQLSLQAI